MAHCMRCKHCRYSFGKKRIHYRCVHPNQEVIRNYFNEHKIQKDVAYIGSVVGYDKFPVKNTPKWCPKALQMKVGVNNETQTT